MRLRFFREALLGEVDKIKFAEPTLNILPLMASRSRLAIVLYSFSGRRDRQRLLYHTSLSQISRMDCASVFLTLDQAEVSPEWAGLSDLRLDTPTGYEHLPDKTIAMFRVLTQTPGWDYVIKCDDDVLLDPAAIRTLAAYEGLPDYQGVAVPTYRSGNSDPSYHRGKCTNPVYNKHDLLPPRECEGLTFAIGHCYVLSRRAVTAAIEEIDSGLFSIESARASFDLRGIGAEDVLVAYLLKQRGITPVESLRLFQSPFRLRGIVRCMFRELLLTFRKRHFTQLCIGALTNNRSPWPGEYAILRGWFTFQRLLSRAISNRWILSAPLSSREHEGGAPV